MQHSGSSPGVVLRSFAQAAVSTKEGDVHKMAQQKSKPKAEEVLIEEILKAAGLESLD